MIRIKEALYQFNMSPNPQTAKVARKAVEFEIALIRVTRLYAFVMGTVSFITLYIIVHASKGKQEKEEGNLIPIIRAVAFLIFASSFFILCFSYPAQWVNGSLMKKLEKFECH